MSASWPEKDLLTSQEAATRLSISRRTLWRLQERGELPPPVRYGLRIVRWKAADIRAYLDGLIVRRT
jgi:excisionase family DNA binding protein